MWDLYFCFTYSDDWNCFIDSKLKVTQTQTDSVRHKPRVIREKIRTKTTCPWTNTFNVSSSASKRRCVNWVPSCNEHDSLLVNLTLQIRFNPENPLNRRAPTRHASEKRQLIVNVVLHVSANEANVSLVFMYWIVFDVDLIRRFIKCRKGDTNICINWNNSDNEAFNLA